MHPRLQAIYHIRCDARSIEERARAIAVEQSVEMPVAAIEDDFVRSEIVGRVEAIRQVDDALFEVRIALAAETVGADAGQLNMLFGNSSLHEDVVLHDVDLPAELVRVFGGPRHGLHELRRRVGAGERALTCSALKPQGLPPAALAELARRFAQGGIDYIKDDHGLADQAYSPFAQRLEAVAAALRGIERAGGRARYVPSLSGELDGMRRQIAAAQAAGVDTVMIAPMIAGLANFWRPCRRTLARLHRPSEHGRRRAHRPAAPPRQAVPPRGPTRSCSPTMADASVTPQIHAGARAALEARDGLKPCVPVPAGGMSTGRVREMLDFYGADVMLLIGGALLQAGGQLVEATAAFVAEVHGYDYG